MKKSLLLSFLLLIKIACLAQNGLSKYAIPPTSNKFKTCITADMQGNYWLGFAQCGVKKFSTTGLSWLSYDTSNSGICSNRVKCINIDNAGSAYIGTEAGLSKFDGLNWTTYNTSNSNLLGNSITCIAFHASEIFIGTQNGLSIFDGTNWRSYTQANSGLVSDSICAIAFGNAGELWIGTQHGLSLLQNSNWTSYQNTLTNPTSLLLNVNQLLVDASNALFLLCDNGFFKLSGGMLESTNCSTHSFPFSENSNLGKVVGLYKKGNEVLLAHFSKDDLSLNWNGTYYSSTLKFSHYSPQQFIEAFRMIPIPDQTQLSFSFPAPAFNSNSTFATSFNYGLLSDTLYLFDYSFQAQNQIENPLDSYLDINQVNAKMLFQGDMCWDLHDIAYEVPKCSKKNSIFASALWIGGYDNAGDLHTAAMTYRQSGLDYWPGPLDTLTATCDFATMMDYAKIWKINRYDIEQFKSNFFNGNVANGSYIIPKEILDWPAHGSGNYSRKLAPFFDFNADGIYNPYAGDYPLIKGDQELFWIYNDAYAQHTESEGMSLGIEVHTAAYAYTCDQLDFTDSNNVLNFTTFYNHKIINRSHETYHDVYVGIWMDPDLGNPNNDLVGCDSALSAGFVYTATNDDSGNGENNYGINPPMQNNLILKGPRANPNDGIDNDRNGITDEPGESLAMTNFMFYRNDYAMAGNPTQTFHFYNYLKSIWKDHNHLSYGGDGFQSTTATNYMYSGTPYLSNSWVQTSLTDGRMICSMGPFTLAPGEEQTIDNAFVFSWDSAHANGLNTSIAKNKADLKRVQHWFLGDSYPSCLNLGLGLTRESTSFSIYPNPANEKITVLTKTSAGGSYEIRNLMGKLVDSGTLKANVNSVSIENLKTGMYLMRIFSEGNTSSLKFVKE